MGEVKKFRFNARTLDDAIVKDGLEAVSVLNGKEPYFLVGGIATQSYLPTRCRRPTSDVDFALVRPLSKPEFRDMVAPVAEYLHDKGYDVSTHVNNRSRSFALDISKEDSDYSPLCLEFVHRNKESFEKHKTRLEREYTNTRQKIIEGRESICRVSSPEDIALPKLVRSINSLRRDPQFINYIQSRLEPLSDEEVTQRIAAIGEIRAEAVANAGDPFLAEKLRIVSDVYDIRILSEIVGFNPEYFKTAEHEWHDINASPELRQKMFGIVLPMFL